MKKIFCFIVVCLLVVAYLKTNKFTYIGGELNPEFVVIVRTIAILIAITVICYTISGIAKKYANDTTVTPFKQE